MCCAPIVPAFNTTQLFNPVADIPKLNSMAKKVVAVLMLKDITSKAFVAKCFMGKSCRRIQADDLAGGNYIHFCRVFLMQDSVENILLNSFSYDKPHVSLENWHTLAM